MYSFSVLVKDFTLIVIYSFEEMTENAVRLDLLKTVLGYMIMFIYTMIMLGRPNMVENRSYLALAGITAVLLGLVMSIGISMALGLKFVMIHGMLPYLAMGNI